MNRKSMITILTGVMLLVSFLVSCTGAPTLSISQPAISLPMANLSSSQLPQIGTSWTIGLDPGHGWQGDPGAIGNGLQENTVNLDIALKTKTILENNGIAVVLTRTGDDSHALTEAAKVINAENPDLVVSIHANSGGSSATGTEACYTVGKNTDAESQTLATLLTNSISNKLALKNRGIFPENADSRCARKASTGWNQLYIHNMNPPTALIETAFLSNPSDADLLKNRSQDFAQAIANAIIAYIKNTQLPIGTTTVVPSTYTPQPPAASTNTSTILIFDTSGSMEDLDASGVVKLDAAKDAGIKLLDVIDSENKAGGVSAHEVSIVEFSDDARVNVSPTTDIKYAEDALNVLYTTGGTGMPKGLRTALDLYPSNPTDKSFIILLSDGLPNIGLNNESDESVIRQQVLDLASEAGQRGICVFTVGFGDPLSGTIDEDFLQQVARNSGCGSYQNAGNAWELANIYISLRHASAGSTLLSESGPISQDQLLDIGNAQVPDNQSMILFTLNWPGSQLDAILRDPNGQLVDQNYPGVAIARTDTLVSIIIQNPQTGQWSISARGVDVPEGVTTYNAVLSVRPNLNPPTPQPVTPQPIKTSPVSTGSPLLIVSVILAVAGTIIYTMTVSAKRSGRRSALLHVGAPASLIFLNGEYSGRSIPVTDGVLVGRSSACSIRLNDPSVSRQHAQMRYAGGHWYIQDMKSQVGIYVNGERIQAKILKHGDRIRIGITEFVFN